MRRPSRAPRPERSSGAHAKDTKGGQGSPQRVLTLVSSGRRGGSVPGDGNEVPERGRALRLERIGAAVGDAVAQDEPLALPHQEAGARREAAGTAGVGRGRGGLT